MKHLLTRSARTYAEIAEELNAKTADYLARVYRRVVGSVDGPV